MQTEIHSLDKLRYAIRYPDSYRPGERYPVIFLLHGAGGRGESTDVLLDNPYFWITAQHADFPFISVAPLCSANTWFDLFETLERLVLRILEKSFTDTEHVYVIGASMGGYATWQLAMSLPQAFAAIVPICGGGMYWNAARLRNVAVWAFHGGLDETVFPEESEKMVNAVTRNGGDARLTIYPENGHDAWSDTYANPEVFTWLLSHKNENAAELIDIYHDSKIYG